jgi:uncharacterized membrane protein
MPSQVSSPSAGPEGRASRWAWLLPAGTFLAGCALGGVVVGVGAVGGDDEPPAPSSSAAAADAGADSDDEATDDEGTQDEESGLYVRVPESCVQTADDASSLVEQVDRVVEAVADLDPERLRQTVDDVQQVRDEVQDVAEQCRTAAADRLADESGADPSASPAS